MRNRQLWGGAGLMAVAGALFFATKFYGVYNYTSVAFNAGGGTWQFNGAVTASGVELVTSGSGAGGAIYLPALANPADYEVRTTLRLNSSGGTYVTFIRASNDALPGNQGSWYALEIQNPTFSSAPGSPCTATAVLSKRIAGSYAVLSSAPVPCRNLMQVRLVAISYDATNGALLGYVDNHGYLYAGINNPQLPSGKPGAGLISAPSGSGIAQFDFGARDTLGPNAIDANYLSTWT
ncbi:MAG: hypothetical protein SFV51_19960, partial [Bryobacteraceae bacterium]|nr:hypothetical protein [Bryobacteraceae bacterium]